ncbi:Cyclic nucleotide-binding domain protein [compost metagenome]
MWQNFTYIISQLCTPDEDALRAAQKLFKEELLPKGTYFVQEGKVCTRLAFVHKGLFRSFYVDEQGEEVTYCFAKEADIETSFESFISGEPSAISIIAMEEVEILVIEKEDLNSLLEKYLFWNRLSRMLTEKEYLKMTRHAAESKTGSARVKYLNLLEQHPGLLQRVPLHYIASYLGISSRHLTRMRKTV